MKKFFKSAIEGDISQLEKSLKNNIDGPVKSQINIVTKNWNLL